METTITVLCENTAGHPIGIVGEHGFSALIERGGERILFDTGQGIGLLANAGRLGKDLSAVDRVVLSHGHYDHTGGLAAFLDQARGGATVFAHPEVFLDRFARVETPEGVIVLPIGVPSSRQDLEARGASFDLSVDFREVMPGVFVTGEVPRPPGWTSGDERLVVRQGEGYAPDPFPDDLSLLVQTDSGPVLVLGCAHAGLHAIVNHVRRQSGVDRFHAIVGGTHLGGRSPAEWEKALHLVQACKVAQIATGHCTGFFATSYLAQRLGDRVLPASAGLSLTY